MVTGLAGLMVAAAMLMAPHTVVAGDKMKVVTTFTVLADMARNVAGDAAEVVSITKPGAESMGINPRRGTSLARSMLIWFFGTG